MLQMIESNIYVINLPSNFSIKNLVIYKWQQHIHDDPFKTSIPSSFLFAQKEYINVILDIQVIFIRENEVLQIQFCERDDMLETIVWLLEKHHNSWIFKSIIEIILNSTQRDQVLPNFKRVEEDTFKCSLRWQPLFVWIYLLSLI